MQYTHHELRLRLALAERDRHPQSPRIPPARPARRTRSALQALRRHRRPAGRLDVHEYLLLEFTVDDR